MFSREPGFSLGRLNQSAGLRKHGAGVVNTVTTAVGMLTDLPGLVPVLVDLGKRHKNYGVVPLHYDVVGQALLATLEEGLPKGTYTAEVKSAFAKMWGVVATTMQSECGY